MHGADSRDEKCILFHLQLVFVRLGDIIMIDMAVNKQSLQATTPAALFAFVKPYVVGARTQLERYLEARRLLKTHQLAVGSYMDRCIYELSSLLEHLDSIEAQLRSIGINLPAGNIIRDFRTHLRHDARGEIDKRSDSRAKRLGLKDGLQVSIEYLDSGIKMGSTELTAQQINTYINMAETIIWAWFLGG
jgi:hypothetical protein